MLDLGDLRRSNTQQDLSFGNRSLKRNGDFSTICPWTQKPVSKYNKNLKHIKNSIWMEVSGAINYKMSDISFKRERL